MYNCDQCQLVFSSFQLKANHVRWYHKESSYSEEGLKNLKQKVSIKNNERLEKKHGPYIEFTQKCEKCDNICNIRVRRKKRKEKYYCSTSCANKRILSIEAKQKISIGVKLKWQDDDYAMRCSQDKGGVFTSKGERNLRDWFIEIFKSEEWTFGGLLIKENNIRVSRDLFSKKMKTCIEYDGIWHFQDICGQLERKQIKDKALNEWCLLNDWKMIRIKDEIYQQNPTYWRNRIHDIVLYGKEKITLLY